MDKSRPKVFIGSSTEGKHCAWAIQSNLRGINKRVEVTTWDKVFSHGYGNLENLLAQIQDQDFAVFVWSPDDRTQARGKTFTSVRDNLVFEFGLFLGKLGRDRVFAVIPDNQDDLRILSDLNGITLLEYDGERAHRDNARPLDIESAFQTACVKMHERIEKYGPIASKADHTIDSILEQIHTLVDRTSRTKYIGKFPDFFCKDVIDCIMSAKKTIHIATDSLSYGSFSVAKVYESYIQHIINKVRSGVQVTMIVYNEEHRSQGFRSQFARNEKQWEELNRDPLFRELLVGFSTREGKAIPGKEDFFRALEDQELQEITNYHSHFSVAETSQIMPLFLWIADNKEAIFSIPTFTTSSSEYAFKTVDADLVESLHEIWNRYRENSHAFSVPVTVG
ncbi:MAG TPA: TIR domain-containing protein [Flavitalea sp.]|nr:TIR domain-containing protein [Flavitalea sp.]